MTLNGKRILVVGASSGIGKAVARAVSEVGAEVLLCARSRDKLEALAGELPGEASALPVDVTDEEAVKAALDGAGELDGLVCTAGAFKVGPVRDLPTDEARANFEVKFWGAYHVAKWACVRQGGAIVLCSGIWSQRPQSGVAQMASVNAALEGLARSLAVEYAPTRVNCVSPGVTDTELYEKNMNREQYSHLMRTVTGELLTGRPGKPEDVAQAILMLLSNPQITGETLVIDGGGKLA
ncbi:SDR family oxidoreductase [Desulfohalovibrio reitneri]|uniref:SDR family oxidoreductase n=1 Tax=Desulfohalovibrio reitneri TaxID=1307759 RepID=UPI0004A6FAB9|nr:SDR family oxidoreductase [Desulfohalovibrio reitneri]